MSQNGKRHDDFAPYLWKSVDFGKTWQDITANIPSGPINVVREDPKNPNVLYVGTDLGVYVTVDGGQKWHVLANNLPTTFVHDLVIHPRDDIMVIGTHGRGVYALDVQSIQNFGKEESEAKAEESDATEERPTGSRRFRRRSEEESEEL